MGRTSRSGRKRKWEAGLWAQAEVISVRGLKANPMEITRAARPNTINRLLHWANFLELFIIAINKRLNLNKVFRIGRISIAILALIIHDSCIPVKHNGAKSRQWQ